MSGLDRFERRLPTLLEELAVPRTPDYVDDILGRTARAPQRPGWTFLERWLPMSAVTTRTATVPRIPWRMIGVVALIILALVGALLIAGSQQRRLPAPFGVAVNGLIAYADTSGAIVTADPVTGEATGVVAGPGNDRPLFSPDGTLLAYLRSADAGGFDIVVARADGSGPVVVTPQPVRDVGYLAWRPDSGALAVVSSDPGPSTLLLYDASRAAEPRVVATDVTVGAGSYNAQPAVLFRPPNGAQIAYFRRQAGLSPSIGLYIADQDGTGERALVDANRTDLLYLDLDAAQWSPDGSRIAFVALKIDGSGNDRVYVINADGTGLRRLTTTQGSGSEGHPAWSPDGTRIAIQHTRYPDDGLDVRPVTVVDVDDGEATEVGILSMNGYIGWGWSPDGASIIELSQTTEEAIGEFAIADAESGEPRSTDWNLGSALSWQRTAP